MIDQENKITCKGCSLELTKENKSEFVKKSGDRGLANQCKLCLNKQKRGRYTSKEISRTLIKGCVYKQGTTLITKVYSY